MRAKAQLGGRGPEGQKGPASTLAGLGRTVWWSNWLAGCVFVVQACQPTRPLVLAMGWKKEAEPKDKDKHRSTGASIKGREEAHYKIWMMDKKKKKKKVRNP